jgi:hypothetical protein
LPKVDLVELVDAQADELLHHEDLAGRVLVVRDHQAVGGHQDGAGELGELLLLVLPGGSVVSLQVRVLFQTRVTVRR